MNVKSVGMVGALAVGVVVGGVYGASLPRAVAVVAASRVDATRHQDTAQPCSNGPVNVSTLHGQTVLNPLTGVRVMAERLYFHER